MATLTFSSKVLQASYAYADSDNSIEASGTFAANSDAVKAVAGTVTGLGSFSASDSGSGLAYTLQPADPDYTADLGEAAVAIVAAINGALALDPPKISGTTPFDASTSVAITGPDGADIFYTTDGSTPTSASTQYSEALTLTGTTTVKAIAVKNGTSSAVASKTFTQNTVEAPEISGTTPFDDSTEATITGPAGATIYYTTDGSTPDSNSSVYSAALTLEATTTVKAIAIKNGVSSTVTSKTFTKN